MKNKGKGSGLALVIILVVALMIAFLAMKNLGSKGAGQEIETQSENYVQQAQDLVNQINQAQQQAGQGP